MPILCPCSKTPMSDRRSNRDRIDCSRIEGLVNDSYAAKRCEELLNLVLHTKYVGMIRDSVELWIGPDFKGLDSLESFANHCTALDQAESG